MKTSVARAPGLMVVATMMISMITVGQVHADHESRRMIGLDAKQLNCLAVEMHDEIKIHFKGVKGYGKLIGLNAQVRTKSAAIARRVKRNPCYRGIDRDLRKLAERTCEFTKLFDEVIRCGHCKIAGDILHVMHHLDQMNELAAIMSSVNEHGIVLVPEIHVNHVDQRFEDLRPVYGEVVVPYGSPHGRSVLER